MTSGVSGGASGIPDPSQISSLTTTPEQLQALENQYQATTGVQVLQQLVQVLEEVEQSQSILQQGTTATATGPATATVAGMQNLVQTLSGYITTTLPSGPQITQLQTQLSSLLSGLQASPPQMPSDAQLNTLVTDLQSMDTIVTQLPKQAQAQYWSQQDTLFTNLTGQFQQLSQQLTGISTLPSSLTNLQQLTNTLYSMSLNQSVMVDDPNTGVQTTFNPEPFSATALAPLLQTLGQSMISLPTLSGADQQILINQMQQVMGPVQFNTLGLPSPSLNGLQMTAASMISSWSQAYMQQNPQATSEDLMSYLQTQAKDYMPTTTDSVVTTLRGYVQEIAQSPSLLANVGILTILPPTTQGELQTAVNSPLSVTSLLASLGVTSVFPASTSPSSVFFAMAGGSGFPQADQYAMDAINNLIGPSLTSGAKFSPNASQMTTLVNSIYQLMTDAGVTPSALTTAQQTSVEQYLSNLSGMINFPQLCPQLCQNTTTGDTTNSLTALMAAVMAYKEMPSSIYVPAHTVQQEQEIAGGIAEITVPVPVAATNVPVTVSNFLPTLQQNIQSAFSHVVPGSFLSSALSWLQNSELQNQNYQYNGQAAPVFVQFLQPGYQGTLNFGSIALDGTITTASSLQDVFTGTCQGGTVGGLISLPQPSADAATYAWTYAGSVEDGLTSARSQVQDQSQALSSLQQDINTNLLPELQSAAVAAAVQAALASDTGGKSLQDLFSSIVLDHFMPGQESYLQSQTDQLNWSNWIGGQYTSLVGDTSAFSSANTVLTFAQKLNNPQGGTTYQGSPAMATAALSSEKSFIAQAQTNTSAAIQKIQTILQQLTPGSAASKAAGTDVYLQDPALQPQIAQARQDLEQQLTGLQGVQGNLTQLQNIVSTISVSGASGATSFTLSFSPQEPADFPNCLTSAENALVSGGAAGSASQTSMPQLAQEITTSSQNMSSQSQTQQMTLQLSMTEIQQEWTVVSTALQILNGIYQQFAGGIRGQ